ncbi:MAG: hypothetical protein JNK30_16800, partial [Phenylobacterium sp.]|uniref:hypothetical protein n=1 Tax=Phenylobacterium sp. TaxID=1871053 RepID=UPI001A3B1B82
MTAPRLLPLALAFAGAAAGYAQAADEADAGRILEELVVTADRGFAARTVQVGAFRNARVIDTPLTVNVISRDVLD